MNIPFSIPEGQDFAVFGQDETLSLLQAHPLPIVCDFGDPIFEGPLVEGYGSFSKLEE